MRIESARIVNTHTKKIIATFFDNDHLVEFLKTMMRLDQDKYYEIDVFGWVGSKRTNLFNQKVKYIYNEIGGL